eukprot:8903424-Pyramimonas_sp.AAC.1
MTSSSHSVNNGFTPLVFSTTPKDVDTYPELFIGRMVDAVVAVMNYSFVASRKKRSDVHLESVQQ